MPKKPFDYSKTEIYKIIPADANLDFCYVGHTTNFTERKKRHRENVNTTSKYNIKLYQTIRDNGGWCNFKMVFIEKWPCESLREAGAREQHWMDELKPNMNGMSAFRTKEEHLLQKRETYYRNHEANLAYDRKYKEEHKEQAKERVSKPFTCECGSQCYWGAKARHFKTKRHQKYLANREKQLSDPLPSEQPDTSEV